MNRYIRKILIFIIFLFFVDLMVGKLGNLLLCELGKNDCSGNKIALNNYSINFAMPDIAVIGSSPALSAYIPDVIEDSIRVTFGAHMEVRNVSCYVQGMPYFLAEVKNLIHRKKPKLIVLDIVPKYLSDFKDHFEVLYPFYHNNSYIRDMINKKIDWKEKLLLHSSLYSLNTSFFHILCGFKGNKSNKGYWPNYGREKFIVARRKETSDIDQGNLDIFIQLIELTQLNNINLVVVWSPSLVLYSEECETVKALSEICHKYSVPYFNFSQTDKFRASSLFSDDSHLNDTGAHMFSSLFFCCIKDYIKELIDVDKKMSTI